VALHFADLADQHQPLVLKLPDPLLLDPEFFAHLSQSVFLAVHHSGTHPQNVRRAVVQID
jgi:hypothetical protein